MGSQRKRFIIVFTILVVALVTILGLVFGLKTTPKRSMQIRYPGCKEIHSTTHKDENLNRIGDGSCDRLVTDNLIYGLNTPECGFDGGDCVDFNLQYINCGKASSDKYNRNNSDSTSAEVSTHTSLLIDLGRGSCKSKYNIPECGYDHGLCRQFNEKYPNCRTDFPALVGDGTCDTTIDANETTMDAIKTNTTGANTVDVAKQINVESCKWDGGDCLIQALPSCKGVIPKLYKDGKCDDMLNTKACDFDGGDCD